MREHTLTRNFARIASLLWVCLAGLTGAWAQTTYHLHAAVSSTPGAFQLQTAGPNPSSASFMSGSITVAGDYQVAGFDTQAGVPGTLGYFPTGSQITFSVWMQATKSTGALYPEAKLFVNNSSGALFCTGRSTAPLTTSLQPFNFSCTTTANVGLQTADRLYLWVGAAQSGMGSPTLRAKLSVEGTLNGNYDSQITVPQILLVPQIAILPTSGGVGTLITITGTNLGDGSNSVVTFNGIPSRLAAAATWNSNGSVTATVPLGAFSGNVVLTLGGVPSNGVFFSDTSPSISGLSVNGGTVPAYIPPGTALTISGANFGTTQGSSTVTFSDGTTSVPGAVVNGGWSNTAVTVAVPRGPTAGNVNVWIRVNNTASNSKSFVLQPVIDSLSATSGPVGSSFAINGAGFGGMQGNAGNVATFGGQSLVISGWNQTTISTNVPSVFPAGTTTVAVKVNGVPSNGVPFAVTPVLLTLSTNTGLPGTPVTLTGTNFGASQGPGSAVFFTGVSNDRLPATNITRWTATGIDVTVPNGAVTGNVLVSVNGADSNGLPFTVPPPHIDHLSRSSGPVGIRIAIYGSNFGTATGTVNFPGGGIEKILSWSDTKIWVTVSCSAVTGSITVTRGDGGAPSNSVLYTVTSQ
jgi:hypothetical protein